MLSFFPRDVLDEILNFIESVSEGFPSYSFTSPKPFLVAKNLLAAFCMTSLVYYNHLLFGGGFSNSKNISSGFQLTVFH